MIKILRIMMLYVASFLALSGLTHAQTVLGKFAIGSQTEADTGSFKIVLPDKFEFYWGLPPTLSFELEFVTDADLDFWWQHTRNGDGTLYFSYDCTLMYLEFGNILTVYEPQQFRFGDSQILQQWSSRPLWIVPARTTVNGPNGKINKLVLYVQPRR